jgi:hypothetical protein
MYKDKQTIIFLKNIDELISFKEFISNYQTKKLLYKDIPKTTKVFMRCETSFTSIIYKLNRLIPHYVGYISLYLWKRFFELKIYNHLEMKKVPNIQNILLQNNKITTTQYQKYKSEKIIVISKDLETLTFFRKKIEPKLLDFSINVFPMFKHLEVWIKTNKVDRIIIDFDLQTDMFTDALQSLDYFKKMDFCFNAFFMQRLYIIVDDDKIDNILEHGKKYSHVHIIKKSNLKEDFILKKLYTS